MLGDELVDKGTIRGQRRHRRFFIVVHQPAVARDIRGEDCRQTSLERGSFHPKKPLSFHEMTERHQWADAIADDLSDCEHRR
jgi:hypothetical protein